MNRPAKIAVSVVAIILLLAATTYGWRTYSNKKKLKELQAKAAERFSQPPSAPGASPGRGREGFREFREQLQSLPESYQQDFRQSMGAMFMQREEQKMDKYLVLSKVERKKFLDKEIIEGEKRRKEWEARRKQREAERPQTVSTNGGNAGSGQPAGGGGGPDANGRRDGQRGGGSWRGGSLSARLDSTSPQFRAKRAEYRRDMEQRRKELGLPADSRPGRR
jgi:hypothetical protein